MPINVRECKACKHRYEVLTTFKDGWVRNPKVTRAELLAWLRAGGAGGEGHATRMEIAGRWRVPLAIAVKTYLGRRGSYLKPGRVEQVEALSHPEGKLECPACGSPEYERIIAPVTGIDLGGAAGVGRMFPYFDRALGCEVNSATHRRWLLTHYPDGRVREFALRPTDGAWCPEEEIKEEVREREADEKAYNEYIEYMTTGPDRASYHKMLEVTRDLVTRQDDTALDKLMEGTGY